MADDVDQNLAPTAEEEQAVRALLAFLRRVRFGSLQVTVQDGHVVQIDTLEKRRITPGVTQPRGEAETARTA